MAKRLGRHAFAAGLLLVACVVSGRDGASADTFAIVPAATGQTLAAATTAITGAGLAVGTVTEVYSVTVPAGLVISQFPPAGTQVGFDSTVELTVSRGPQSFAIRYAASPSAGGTVTGPAVIEDTAGTATLTVTANPGYSIAGVTASNGTVSADAPYILSNVTADTTVTATFTARSNAVTYVAGPSAHGTVTGPATILTGGTATLSVTAHAGYRIASVTASNGSVTATTPYVLSSVTTDTTVTAIFTAKNNAVNYSAAPSPGGTVTGPPAILTGDTATLTVAANAGYSIVGVTATNGDITPNAPYVLSNVTSDTTVTATFTANTNAVGYSAAPPATGTVTGPATILTGDTATLTVTANPGYTLTGVSATNGSVTATAPYMLSDVTAATIVIAAFTPNTNRVRYSAVPSPGGAVLGPETILTGGTAMLTVTANAGYSIAGVTATNGSITSSAPYVLSNVTADTTVTATFTANTNTVAYSATPPAGGTATGPATILTGGTATLTVTASPGYSVAGVMASNGSITATAPYVLSNVTTDMIVTATFAADSHTVVYSVVPSAGGTVTGPAVLLTDGTATLTVNANPGYSIVSVAASNGTVSAGAPYMLSNVTADTTVTATFAMDSHTVAYISAPTGGGTVSGPESIQDGTGTATVAVTANTGYGIASVTATNGNVTAGAPYILSNVTADTTVTATFDPKPHLVTYLAMPSAGGTVTGPATILTGESATLSVTPQPGYTLVSVTVSRGSITATAPYVLSNVTADTTVRATFAANTNAVTYSAAPAGGGTVSGPETILTGETARLTVTAGSGYDIADVTATSGSITAHEPYILSGVTAATTVTATFVRQQVTVPDVSGMTTEQAQSALAVLGLTHSEAEENSDTVPAGQVIRQEPPAGTSVEVGAQVSLVVSSGPKHTGCGCAAGCSGGKRVFMLDKAKEAFGDFLLGGPGLMVLLTASERRP